MPFFALPIFLLTYLTLVLKNGIEACARSGRTAVFEPYALLFSKYPIHLNCSAGCDWAVLGPKRLTSSVNPPPPPDNSVEPPQNWLFGSLGGIHWLSSCFRALSHTNFPLCGSPKLLWRQNYCVKSGS